MLSRVTHKHAYLFLNGEIHPKKDISLSPTDLIICVDGGVKQAMALGITPHIILGDFDSLPPWTKEHYANAPVEWISHPPEKDQYETDTELALRIAQERNISSVTIYGFSGDRLDHMIANIGLFARFATHLQIVVHTRTQSFVWVTECYEWTGRKGSIVSLVPLSPTVSGITTQGLQYPLQYATLSFGTTEGVSNYLTDTTARITLTAGCLLVAYTH